METEISLDSASCLLSGLRTGDFIARVGGEEFVVLTTALEAGAALGTARRRPR